MELLWETAWEAVVWAFLAQLFGGIVVGLVGGVWREMTPSLPPHLGHAMHPEAASGWAWTFSWFHQHRFAFLSGVFFIVGAWNRLSAFSNSGQGPLTVSAAAFGRRIADQWFGLIVANAFSAFIAVWVVQLVQQFSFTHMLWGVLSETVRPVLQPLEQPLGRLGLLRWLEDMWVWYNQNQSRFLFWFLYGAAMCDDLGLPNLKTLARSSWRRLKRSQEMRHVLVQPKKPEAKSAAPATQAAVEPSRAANQQTSTPPN